MAKQIEYKVVVSATKASDNNNLFRCPRCFKWHTNRWNTKYNADREEDNIKYKDKHLFCDKCEDFFWKEAVNGSNHPAAIKVKNNCEQLGRSLN